MSSEPVHKYFGTPISEWIRCIPNELSIDAVGLWQIIPVGIEDFSLENSELEEFCKDCIVALVNSGAKPVVASDQESKYWQHQPQYGNQATEIACAIIKAWKKSPELATHGGIWFDLLQKNVAEK
jgi:hypothetical protein